MRVFTIFAKELMNKLKSEILLQTSTNIIKEKMTSNFYILELFK